MENATKALLIAAAVLIAILIISLGIVIYQKAAESMSNADLSEAEAASFNAKFKAYEGTNVSTANVNALLDTVLSHNQQEAQAGTERYVTVTVTDSDNNKTTQKSNAKAVTTITGNDYYTVQCTYSNGIVTKITATAN